MHIGLFGGVFNPPHRGHLMIAQQVLDFTDIDEVWFLPNWGQHPPKPGVAAVGHRLAMTRMLRLPKTKVSTLEIEKQLDGNTINLLPHLPKKHSYTFIMGADWLPTFRVWGHWEELLEKLPFLVFPRNGYPNEPLYKSMKLLEHKLLITSNISATLVRERVKNNLSIEQFVSEGIVKYIKEHSLYAA
ncbi:nicotinate (nicotinamide) nucleotide adenylyltransferase [Candidatus Gottesmanbacteria bacterium]|nr:nicotinate (nicotinamide) nucleotide adenylyltransferase [Candidatus Gottesmanbacteria bacterium]